MEAKSAAYAEVDRKWRSTARLILGAEVGGISDYAGWLSTYMSEHKLEPLGGGQEAMFQFDDFGKAARKIGFSSVDFMKKYPPLSPNEMKDIDSIAQALGERAAYAGDICLGNSRFVEHGANVLDSSYVYMSAGVSESSYVAYATDTRLSKMIFGGDQNAQSEMLVGCFINRKATRCLEAWACDEVADVLYSSYCIGCQDCMFSFNLVGKRHCIGNCPLPREKYLEVKKRLLEQLSGELEAGKRLPSLRDFAPPLSDKPAIRIAPKARQKDDMARIEQEFSNTSKLILGAPLPGGIDRYSKWLSQNIFEVKKAKSALAGADIYTSRLLFSELAPKDRLIGVDEAQAAGEQLRLNAAEASALSLANARNILGKVAFFCCERRIGINTNNIHVPIQINASNCYSVSNIPFGKDCAFCTWPRNSEHCYGSARTFECSFVIRCFNSLKLSRCFECDCCRDCTGAYFCHNCENVHDSMFCFNAKNLRYAVGNAELPREEYLKIKARVLAEINGELDRKNAVGRSIFSLSHGKK